MIKDDTVMKVGIASTIKDDFIVIIRPAVAREIEREQPP